jgi:hypothetical protein
MFGLRNLLSTCITGMQAVLHSPSQYGTPALTGRGVGSIVSHADTCIEPRSAAINMLCKASPLQLYFSV